MFFKVSCISYIIDTVTAKKLIVNIKSCMEEKHHVFYSHNNQNLFYLEMITWENSI